jgi:hypothetical protein
MSEQKIETRVPAGSQWVKLVSEVDAAAKDGFDWSGEWLNSWKLIDLAPGAVVIAANNAGSNKNPRPGVRLCVLLQNGSWAETVELDSAEWGYELRGLVRDLLAARGNQAAQQRLVLEYSIPIVRAERDRYVGHAHYTHSLARCNEQLTRLVTELALLPSATAKDVVDPELLDLAAKLRACVNAQRAKTKTAAAHDAIDDALSHLDLLDRALIDINDETLPATA